MGTTCSSCCWSDRRASDVLHDDGDTLQTKLLDRPTDEYDCNSSTLEDSTVNPYSRSLELRAKEAWPRPLVTPSSEHAAYDDTEQSGYGTDDRSSRGSSSASTSTSPPNLAWNLREAGSAASFVDVQTLDDSTSAAALPAALRSLSASDSARSSASDSYASNRELPTYESLLFADDVQNSSPRARGSQDSDGSFDDGDNDEDMTTDLDRDSTGGSAPRAPPSSAAHAGYSTGDGKAIQRK